MEVDEKLDLVLLGMKIAIILYLMWHFLFAPETVQTLADLVVGLLIIQFVQIFRDMLKKLQEIFE